MNIPDFTGKRLGGRYELRRRIGYGGMATVYAAVDLQLDKPVAVKVLNPQFFHNQDYFARFRQEAFSAAKIRHSHLVDVTDFGQEDALAFFVMELLEGESLSERLHRVEGPMPWTEALAIVVQVCEALAYAHERGVIHRDVKPGNIFLVAQPGRPGQVMAKLLDLGIAKVLRDALELRSAAPDTRLSQGTPGTPEYMAPEQTMGWEVDHRADLYAVGVTLYRMLTGHLPFYSPNSAFEVQRMHIELPPVALRLLAPDAKIPSSVEAIVLRTLAKRPEERFESARQLADALLAAQRAESTSSAPVVEDEPTTSYMRPESARPHARRLMTVFTMMSGLMTASAVFMLLMLTDVPFVKAFAERWRSEPVGPKEPITIPLPFVDETPKPEGLPSPPASTPVDEPKVINLFSDNAPSRPSGGIVEVNPGGPPTAESGPGPLLGQTPPAGGAAKDPSGQAKAFVQSKLPAIVRECKDPRTPTSTPFTVTYDLATGAIKARPDVDKMSSKCVSKALGSIKGKALGSGTAQFKISVNV